MTDKAQISLKAVARSGTYDGPIGVGSTLQRGDVTIRLVGDFDQRYGTWPYEVIRVEGREVAPGGRRRIAEAKLRREFEPMSQNESKEEVHG